MSRKIAAYAATGLMAAAVLSVSAVSANAVPTTASSAKTVSVPASSAAFMVPSYVGGVTNRTCTNRWGNAWRKHTVRVNNTYYAGQKIGYVTQSSTAHSSGGVVLLPYNMIVWNSRGGYTSGSQFNTIKVYNSWVTEVGSQDTATNLVSIFGRAVCYTH